MFARLICAIKGHAYSDKDVLVLSHTKATMETCDRCGAGESDLAFAKGEAVKFQASLTPRPA